MVDDDIAAIFTTVAQEIEPEMAAVIREAASQGRRRRARRRLAVALTAGISVVAVAIAVTVGANLAGRTIHGSSPIAPSKHRHGLAVKPTAHHTRPAVPQEHGHGMEPSQMLAALRPLLPQGDITYVASYYMRGWLELNFNDGKGAVDMIVAVSPTVTRQELQAQMRRPLTAEDQRWVNRQLRSDELYCPSPPLTNEGTRPAGAPPISCTRSVLANGNIVMEEVTEADVVGYYDYAVYIARPDGVTVSIDVGNGTLEGTPHYAQLGWPWVDRAVPPGSLAFWETVVASPKWHL